jgi:hypothetical protein
MYDKGRMNGTVRSAIQTDAGIRSVDVAGDFSGWTPIAMTRGKNGSFVKSVPVATEPFEYKFLVDGQWVTDPDHSRWAANGLGGFNSVGQFETLGGASGAASPNRPVTDRVKKGGRGGSSAS